MSDDEKINKYFNVKNKYQEQYNKKRNALKDAGDKSPAEIHEALLQFSKHRKCSECFRPGGILFEETKHSLIAKCLAEKPCLSINIKRRVVSDLWESFRSNKSIISGLDKSLIIMKYRSQTYIPLENTVVKKSSPHKYIKPRKDTPYNIKMDDIILNYIDIEKMRNKEKKIENDIEKIIYKVKNNNAEKIADIELSITEMYDTLREFQKEDTATIMKQIEFNNEQQANYNTLRPLKYAYFAVEEDEANPSNFSLITRNYSTQQCEYTI